MCILKQSHIFLMLCVMHVLVIHLQPQYGNDVVGDLCCCSFSVSFGGGGGGGGGARVGGWGGGGGGRREVRARDLLGETEVKTTSMILA
jgi:uncharacterized membrane protein